MTTATASLSSLKGLNVQQIEQFKTDGYVIVRGLYSSAEIAEIREAFMEQAASGPVAGLSDTGSNGKAFDSGDPLASYPRMMNPHDRLDLPVGPVSRKYLLDPRLFPILKQLFGEEPAGVQTMFYFKPAGARGQALHQDNFYLRVAPDTCMAAWLAVDDCDPENGGMVIVPGTKDMDVVCPEKADPSQFFTTELVSVPNGLKEVPAIMKAGDVLFFNGSVIHGSYPNTSKDRFRRSLIAHYVPRNTREVWEGYRAISFDDQRIEIAPATGGGPCGTLQAPGGLH